MSCGYLSLLGFDGISCRGQVAEGFFAEDVHQAIAEVDPIFAVNAIYVYEQVGCQQRPQDMRFPD